MKTIEAMNLRAAAILAALLVGCGDGTENDGGDGGVGADADGGETTVDPCDGVSSCAAEGTSCDGDALVTCAPNADGCLVQTETPCLSGEACDPTAEPPACAPVESCEDECAAEGGACDAGVAVNCATDPDTGCLVETRVICDSGETCFEADGISGCMEDACSDIDTCETVGTVCDGDVLVTCAVDENACLAESRLDCSADGLVCAQDPLSGAAACESLCENAPECESEGVTCDGTVLVTCVVGELGCLEVTALDCAGLREGAVCDTEAGLCATDTDPCEGANLCEPGTPQACAADTLVTCAVDPFGCHVLGETDCTAVENGYCGDAGCEVIVPGACDGVPAELQCDTIGRTCEADATVSECSRDADGCLVRTSIPCGEGDVCVEGECVDICSTRVTCAEQFFCDGDAAVACEVDSDGCVVEASRESCEFGCDASACRIDPCIEFGCDVEFEPPTCAGTVLTECVFDEFLECFVTSEVDCAVDGLECVDGFMTMCAPPPCGDGNYDPEREECDDGNLDAGDGCSTECLLEEGYECVPTEVDFGLVSVCGLILCSDGIVAASEQCDDGNFFDEDGCSSTCAVEPGFVCVSEPSVCTTPVCGNEAIEVLESCDDGSVDGADGCSAACALELSPVAGATLAIDGVLDETDPLWNRPTSDCAGFPRPRSHHHEVIPITNPTEAPIDVAVRGQWGEADGFLFVLTPTFGCVLGADNHGTVFESFIEVLTIPAGETRFIVVTTFGPGEFIPAYRVEITTIGCGDGFVRSGEECDDSNPNSGDGCSVGCTIEDGFDCGGVPSLCSVVPCGDGVIGPREGCDDGGTAAEDGCSSSCDIEPGYLCRDEPSFCAVSACGDTLVTLPFESCEDGNTDGLDGCSAACVSELSIATPIVFSGSLGDPLPTFVRATPGCVSDFRETYFEAIPVTNPLDVEVLMTVVASWADGDGLLLVYDSAFSPADSTVGCVDGNDDFGGRASSRVRDVAVPAGGTVFLVPTTYEELATITSYELTVTAE